jgi:hypothetical protein
MQTFAGAGTADITPDTPVPLAGAEIRTGRFQGVADRLEANVLVLKQDGPPLVLISADLLFVGRELRAEVLHRLRGAVADENLFFAASHTHFAPATDDRRPRLGRLDATYFEQLCEKISGLVDLVLGRPMVPAVLEYVEGRADHAVNRRVRAAWHLSRRGPRIGGIVGAPNPAGPHDEAIHLLRVSGEHGDPLAVIWSYACHPVAFPRPQEVSAEFPGRVRRRLRECLPPETPVLFWQGFAGDVRPPEMNRDQSAQTRLKRVLLGPRFGRFTGEQWESWAESLASRVVATVTARASLRLTGSFRTARLTRPLAEFVSETSGGPEVAFHSMELGSALTVVGIAAEVVTEYASLVRGVFPGSIVIPVGYIDEVYGYLPTARMVREGGYEARWFLQPFGLRGRLHPEIERHCLSAVTALARAR